jgi:prepilin-type N-terminal cleavage/methylation domain-containing protein/uncharacterized repeat protein (TIGR02543 family)
MVKMKKKGFTLVELLAVVAILSLLVIIALPNVMSMFNNAKKNAFTTELKEIYKTAEQKWISDSVSGTSNVYYARVEGTPNGSCSSCQQLSLSGRSELYYMISFNNGGKVKSFYATDKTYQYAYTGNDLKIEDIVIEDVYQVARLEAKGENEPSASNTILTITCNGDNYVDTSIGVVGGPSRMKVTYYNGTDELGTVTYYEDGMTQSFKTASDYSLTKSGYQFQGWGLTSSVKKFDAGAVVTPDIIKQNSGDVKLYAVWKDVVTPSCVLNINGSTVTLSKSNAVQYGLVSGTSSTPSYNGNTSLTFSGSGSFTGFVKGNTGVQKGCRITVTSPSYSCPGGFSLSGNTCRTNAQPRYQRILFRCQQTGSNSYNWYQGSTQIVNGGCSSTAQPSCNKQTDVGNTYYKCTQNGYYCPQGNPSGSYCIVQANQYCSQGTPSGNYCILRTSF